MQQSLPAEPTDRNIKAADAAKIGDFAKSIAVEANKSPIPTDHLSTPRCQLRAVGREHPFQRLTK
jgi:hypothetical protein